MYTSKECISEMIHMLENVRVVHDPEFLSQIIHQVSLSETPVIISFINQHAFNIAWLNTTMRKQLHLSDFLLRDGVGMEFLFRLLGRTPGINCNGTDLIPQILESFQNQSAVGFGTSDQWLSIAAEKIEQSGLVVAYTHHGFAAEELYLDAILRCKPRVILLGMGMPRQEALSHLIKSKIDWPCVIINGGAILDFMADRFVRAPEAIRAVRLEWLFRLMLEPKRLFGRYVVGGMLFTIRAFVLASVRRPFLRKLLLS